MQSCRVCYSVKENVLRVGCTAGVDCNELDISVVQRHCYRRRSCCQCRLPSTLQRLSDMRRQSMLRCSRWCTEPASLQAVHLVQLPSGCCHCWLLSMRVNQSRSQFPVPRLKSKWRCPGFRVSQERSCLQEPLRSVQQTIAATMIPIVFIFFLLHFMLILSASTNVFNYRYLITFLYYCPGEQVFSPNRFI